MATDEERGSEGRCTCGAVRFRMRGAPLFVHCCHCRWCQRESGSAFALNAMIEADRVQLLQGAPEVVTTPSSSGKGQKILRCPACRVALCLFGLNVRFSRRAPRQGAARSNRRPP